jgi:tetratricopeptide (TPR) repeat protein
MALSRLLCNFVVGFAALALVQCVYPQQDPQTGSTGSSDSNARSRGNVTRPPLGRNQQDSPRQRQQIQRMVFVYGRVVQEDGSQVPSGAVIEMSCNGRTRREADVDPGGYFSFQVGDNNRISSLLPDASDDSTGGPNPFGRSSRSPGLSSGPDSSPTMSILGCELRAALGGYRSSTVILGADGTVGQLNAGTLLLQPIARAPGTLTSATNLGAPRAARKEMDKARKAFQNNKFEDAERRLKTAVDIYPKYAAAWLGLGQVYERTQRFEEARAAFTNAISADDKFVSPYIQLARLSIMEKKWREAADISDRGLSLDPLDFPEGFFFNALAHYNLDEHDAAERSVRKAMRLDSQHRIVQAHLLLADILEQKADFEGAMQQLRLCLTYAPKAPFADSVRARLEGLERSSKASAGRRTGDL